ncbi:MAG: hypothetical protein IJX98_03150 [Clostridia bacterium]|nr:hypothetical protein [Clostridia bacterium]
MKTNDLLFYCALCGNQFNGVTGYACPVCGDLLCAACAKRSDGSCRECREDLELLD